jgi:hypothetical protein
MQTSEYRHAKKRAKSERARSGTRKSLKDAMAGFHAAIGDCGPKETERLEELTEARQSLCSRLRGRRKAEAA